MTQTPAALLDFARPAPALPAKPGIPRGCFTLRMTYCDGSSNDFHGFRTWDAAIADGVARYNAWDGDTIAIVDGEGAVHLSA